MTKPVLSPEALLALWQALENGPTAKEIAAVDDACVESLYALGHDLYKAENFRDAEAVFRALAFLNPKDRRFWMGLGGARQGLGHFSEASDALFMRMSSSLHLAAARAAFAALSASSLPSRAVSVLSRSPGGGGGSFAARREYLKTCRARCWRARARR